MTMLTRSERQHLLRLAWGFGAVTAGLAGAAGASYATLRRQALAASGTIRSAARQAALQQGSVADPVEFRWQSQLPSADGVYDPAGGGRRRTGPPGTLVLSMMGDSTSVGYGSLSIEQVPGVILARAAARQLDRPIRLHTHGAVGAVSADLAEQLIRTIGDAPDVAVIMIGANDVRDRVPPWRAAQHLHETVRILTATGIAVVAATCPDLGVVPALHQPLRRLAGSWSRRLARAQEKAVAAAGGVPVALDRIVSPGFAGRSELFYADGFHPSGQGYARATAAFTDPVIAALQACRDSVP